MSDLTVPRASDSRAADATLSISSMGSLGSVAFVSSSALVDIVVVATNGARGLDV